MTAARREARIAMLRRGITIKTLATETGYSPTTIHNVLSDASISPSARQAITNALQTELWPDVPVTERRFAFPIGTQVVYNTAKEAQENASDELAAGIVTRRGRIVTFVKAATFIKEIENPKRNAKETQRAKNREISSTSVE